MKKIKAVVLVLIMILCGAAFARGMQVEAKANAVQEKLSGEVFRFHVLANSDSKEDQELKMKVKEAVVDYMCENLSNAGNAAEAKAWAIRHKEELIRTAREVLQEEGCNDQITAEVVRCEFPDKTYGDITFPAGWYDALRIKIGKAQGHNWWCVVYPSICFTASAEELTEIAVSAGLTEDEAARLTGQSEGYVFRIQIVELAQKLWRWLSGRFSPAGR